MTPKKIVITGGACSGKTTGLVRLQEHLEKLGHRVIVVPEVATIIFKGAGRPKNPTRNALLLYQKAILRTQLELEKTFEALADDPDTIILTDRGAPDGKAYMSQAEWEAILDDMNLSDYKLLNSYDAVIHLVTAADGVPEAYKLEGVRNETPEEAIEQDKALQRAYLGHGHHKIIDNSTDFPTKIRRVVSEICHILGEPEPLETERKFLVAPPAKLPELCSTSLIEQTYLTSTPGIERRVRKRSKDGSSIYTLTTKQPLSAGVRIEKEGPISATEYIKLISAERDTTRQTIQKRRHCFIHERRCYELDEYISPHKGLWVLEVEVEDLKKPIGFPGWLTMIDEVTADASYSNSSLALGKTLTGMVQNPVA
jgi:CYTH domain-containing protein/predicted ATPase